AKRLERSVGKSQPAQPARFRWTFPKDMFVSRVVWMEKHCVLCWSICSDDWVGGRDADLDRRRSDGHATRIHRAERDGANGASGKSVFWSSLYFSWSARGPGQSFVVRWRRTLSFLETIGARAIYLATSNEWNGVADTSTAFDVA